MMTEEEEFSLLSGGDCQLHSHAFDRSVTHDTVLQYQDSEGMRRVSSDFAVTYGDDFIFVDSTAAPVSLTFPVARGGKTYTVVRIAGGNTVNIAPYGADTVNGAASLSITASYNPVRLKALKGMGWVQI